MGSNKLCLKHPENITTVIIMGFFQQAPVNYRYNLVPFKEIKRFIIYYRQIGINAVILNLAGNVVAFMPFGFFLPLVSEHKIKFFKVFITAFSLSLSIELIQLISKVGSCDVDDLILNTLGGLLGYWCLILRWAC